MVFFVFSISIFHEFFYLGPRGGLRFLLLDHVISDISTAVILGRIPEKSKSVAAEFIRAEILRWRGTIEDFDIDSCRIKARRVA